VSSDGYEFVGPDRPTQRRAEMMLAQATAPRVLTSQNLVPQDAVGSIATAASPVAGAFSTQAARDNVVNQLNNAQREIAVLKLLIVRLIREDVET
jgi:hypothetical protein